MRGRLDKAIRMGLLAAIVFTALAHGAVESWSLATFELMMVGLILLWGVKIISDRRLAIAIPGAALPIAALLVFALAQSIAVTNREGLRSSLSMDVDATRAAALGLFFLLAAFVISTNFFREKDHLRAMMVF